MARYLLLLLALCIVPLAAAAGLTAQSPAEGATTGTAAEFSFASSTHDVIATCELLIDGNVLKTATYDQDLAGRSITYSATLSPGTYQWQVVCMTATGEERSTQTRTVVVESEQRAVKVTPSGVIRGSMVHEFTFRNSAQQRPVTVTRLAPGDYLKVVLEVPPSKITKEFYVRSRLSKNGTNYLWLTHKAQDYYLWEGENSSVDVGQTTILLGFTGMQNNRATVVAYPSVALAPPAEALPEEPPAAEAPEGSEEPAQAPPAEDVDEPESPPEEPPQEPVKRPPQQPELGLFTRIMSWLTGIFGK